MQRSEEMQVYQNFRLVFDLQNSESWRVDNLFLFRCFTRVISSLFTKDFNNPFSLSTSITSLLWEEACLFDESCLSFVSLSIHEVLVLIHLSSVCFEVFDDHSIFVFTVPALDLLSTVLPLGNLALLWATTLLESNIAGLQIGTTILS